MRAGHLWTDPVIGSSHLTGCRAQSVIMHWTSQPQSYWSFDCGKLACNHSAFLHDIDEAVIRHLLCDVPRQLHQAAPICHSDLLDETRPMNKHWLCTTDLSLPCGRSLRGISLGQHVLPGFNIRNRLRIASAISGREG